MKSYELRCGDCVEVLRTMEAGTVDCCVTSPPYFGLRDYGAEGQIGLESTPAEFVEKLVEVFREVRRVLRDDGTLWLNLGDSYAASGRGGGGGSFNDSDVGTRVSISNQRRAPVAGLKPKDLIGIPWRVAFALQADGWYLRQDIIWHKPNPMPESVKDRCTKAHEYIFLLSKSERYYFDSEAMQEPAVSTAPSGNGFATRQGGSRDLPMSGGGGTVGKWQPGGTRNRRSVWTVTTKPYKGAHFATFPPALIEPCILAGSRKGGLVLDPFNGSGTTGEVSVVNERRYVGIDLNPEYIKLAEDRIGAAMNKTVLFNN